jgi:putative addiction module component (TIGR02574 family)
LLLEIVMNAIVIDQLSHTEKLELLETLWQSLSASAQQVPSPAWHGEVLAERLAQAERGEAQFLSLSEAGKRLGLD